MILFSSITYICIVIIFYGCCVSSNADEHIATFDGQSRLSYDVTCGGEFGQTEENHLALRFRTNQASGLMVYTSGYLGDYLLLELVNGRLYLRINLGSTPGLNGETTMKVGSLLDDNRWHKVTIDRSWREVNFTVDNITATHYTRGSFVQLDLDGQIQFGGINNFLDPVKPAKTFKNFSGCLGKLQFGSLDIIQGLADSASCLTSHGSVTLGNCQIESPSVFSFQSHESYVSVAREHRKHIQVSFEFLSYTEDSLLYAHELMPSGQLTLQIDNNGHILYTIVVGDEHTVTDIVTNGNTLDEGLDSFTDGVWHSVDLKVTSPDDFGVGVLYLTVDGRTVHVQHVLAFNTTMRHYFGEGANISVGSNSGFIGCMRTLEVQGHLVRELANQNQFEVTEGLCPVKDRCEPNPCEHGGACSQDHVTFTCDCGQTGYAGSTCHQSSYPISCMDARHIDPDEWQVQTHIDLDGSGPLAPFKAICMFNSFSDTIDTLIHHDSEEPTMVDGCQEPGCYRRPVRYGEGDNTMIREQFDLLTERAASCEQYIKYKCHNSRLLADTGSTDHRKLHWGWWVGRTNNIMHYWGGASPRSGMCGCGVKDECVYSSRTCNCDYGLRKENIFDDGFLTHKEHLPVTELRFGDTGLLWVDGKWGEHTLGPLKCVGDSLFDNTITFRKPDATLNLPTFGLGDIQFHFKTAQTTGVLIHSTGDVHFIELRLTGRDSIQFSFHIGDGTRRLERQMVYPLNDDQWHSVYVEFNRKQVTLKVDHDALSYLDIPLQRHTFTLELSSPLVVGATMDYKDGYVGCIRGLLVNGMVMDLRGMVERGEVTYGLSAGCQDQCSSQPCFHGGRCVEFYSHYTCDCTNTSMTGRDCGKEVGVTLSTDHMIRFELDETVQSGWTDEEVLVVGFSTLEKRGILMMVTNGETDGNHEYLYIAMNNNGGVKVGFAVGFEREEINTGIHDVDLANSQQHVVVVQRHNKGRSLSIAVDDYPAMRKDWNLPDSTDTRLDNPKYIYFGKNEFTQPGEGFNGCIYRAEINRVYYPLKELFANQTGSNIVVQPEDKPLLQCTCLIKENLNPTEDPKFPPIRTSSTPDSDVVLLHHRP